MQVRGVHVGAVPGVSHVGEAAEAEPDRPENLHVAEDPVLEREQKPAVAVELPGWIALQTVVSAQQELVLGIEVDPYVEGQPAVEGLAWGHPAVELHGFGENDVL